jgi:hypothetical protein
MQEIPLSDGVTYHVRINRVIRRGVMKYLPRDKHRFLGSTLKEIVAEYGWEAIDDCYAADA